MLKSIDAVTRRLVVLHMDINRTIIQTDPAGGKTLDDVLNSNVAGRVFGAIQSDRSFAISSGQFHNVHTGTDGINYSDYVDQLVQPPAEMATVSAEERRAIWKKVSASRRQMLHTFTKRGEIGEAFAEHVELQRKALQPIMDAGCQIVPSFFELVNQLSVLEWPFIVVFRTFGNDLDNVLSEWQRFVSGDHFVKPKGPVLSAMRQQSLPPTCGALFRNERGMAVCWDRHVAIPPPPPGIDSTAVEPEAYLSSVSNVTEAHRVSYNDLYEEIMAKAASGGGVLGLVDYYYFWSQNAESRSAGKVYPVLKGDGAPYQLFFDDNIFIGDPQSIVDMRCAESGEPVELKDEAAYCCHVVPYFAITNPLYFWEEAVRQIGMQSEAS